MRRSDIGTPAWYAFVVSRPPHPYEALSWDAAPNERRDAVADLLTRPDEIDVACLVRPWGRKDVWDGAAAVLEGLDQERLTPHLPELLAWLQDSNWPGSSAVLQRLVRFDPLRIGPALRRATRQAHGERDQEWLANLARLAAEMSDGS